MPAVLIKDLPRELHRRLRERAARNRRSMNQETIALLEEVLNGGAPGPAQLPPLLATRRKLTDSWLKSAIRRGRA
jgi:plasmid stability protein